MSKKNPSLLLATLPFSPLHSCLWLFLFGGLSMPYTGYSQPICLYGNEVLRKPAAKVEQFDEALKVEAQRMISTLVSIEGAIGISGPQVGLSKQMAVVDFPNEMVEKYEQEKKKKISESIVFDGKKIESIFEILPITFTNPKIQPIGTKREKMVDGCLSLPGVYGLVERAYEITLKYQDLKGKPHILTCDSLLAFCIQHEADHLQGILFIDKLIDDKLNVDTIHPCWQSLPIYTELVAKKDAKKEEILSIFQKLGNTLDYSTLEKKKEAEKVEEAKK